MSTAEAAEPTVRDSALLNQHDSSAGTGLTDAVVLADNSKIAECPLTSSASLDARQAGVDVGGARDTSPAGGDSPDTSSADRTLETSPIGTMNTLPAGEFPDTSPTGTQRLVHDVSVADIDLGSQKGIVPRDESDRDIDVYLSADDRSSASQHTIRLTEVAPSNSIIVDVDANTGDSWKYPIEMFSSRRHQSEKKVPKCVRSFYRAQNELIRMFEDTRSEVTLPDVRELHFAKRANILIKLSFAANFVLLVAKAVASALSGSLSVISSLVDSAVDLLSGAIMWWSARAVRNRNPYHYPEGRTKLEPVSIVILSVVMAIASVQLIIQSVQKIVALATNPGEKGPTMGVPSIVIISATVVTKAVLFFACFRVKLPSIQVLAQDHRNDVLSNIVALVCGLVGSRWWSYLDALGAILISIYIAISWWRTGREQIKMLTGYTADPQFIQRVTWICLNHDRAIQQIDTVRVFHFGNNFLVEVDIVLPETMTLREAHDIGEPLQARLERMEGVERAFVHLDYEFTHDPRTEHKFL